VCGDSAEDEQNRKIDEYGDEDNHSLQKYKKTGKY
jgi:hypothetical protein